MMRGDDQPRQAGLEARQFADDILRLGSAQIGDRAHPQPCNSVAAPAPRLGIGYGQGGRHAIAPRPIGIDAIVLCPGKRKPLVDMDDRERLSRHQPPMHGRGGGHRTKQPENLTAHSARAQPVPGLRHLQPH